MSTRVHPFLVALLLFAAVMATYSGVGGCDFISLDDPGMTFKNQTVCAGITPQGVREAFTTQVHVPWVPLTTISFMADVSLWGMTPFAIHVENAVLHAAATALLFIVLMKMTGKPWSSALVAALFGLHPVNVESVAWITERKNVLCGFLTMLTLLAWEGHARRWNWRLWLAATFLFVLALLAKPMAVTLPCGLLLLDIWPLRRHVTVGWKWMLVEKLPMFLAAYASSRLTFWSDKPFRNIVSLGELPLDDRITNVLTGYAGYIRMLLFPSSYSVIYPHTMVASPPFPVAAFLLLVAVSAVVLLQMKKRPWLPVGWAWFLGMLVPSVGFVQVGSQGMAGRFSYLAQIGLFMAVVWTAAEFITARRARLAAAFYLALLLSLAALTAKEVTFWKNSIDLYEHALDVVGPVPQVLDLAAAARMAVSDYEGAVRYSKESLRYLQDNANAWRMLGVSLSALRRDREARVALQRAAKLDPVCEELLRKLEARMPEFSRRAAGE